MGTEIFAVILTVASTVATSIPIGRYMARVFTGTKTLPGILGYSDEGKITIEQDIPLKMILLGLEYKISTYPGT